MKEREIKNKQLSRRKSRQVLYDGVAVGGGAPVSVQSMTNTDTKDVTATVNQINRLAEAGCEIIRIAVPDRESALLVSQIKKGISIPLIADIHFDFRLALIAIKEGIDGLRINPGNIGDKDRVEKVANAARDAAIPIRVGVNSGSIAREMLQKYGHPTAEAMVESALCNINLLEKTGFEDIVISMKATDIWMTVQAHQLMAKEVDYPFHIGITEAGSGWKGSVKSAAGIAALLTRGFGDTIRVSLTGDPLQEVKVGWHILETLELRREHPRIISCPTCGRTEINLEKLAFQVEQALADVSMPITVAVMGCAVNGPGEAREADLGIAGGRGEGLIFKKGKLIKKVKEDKLIDVLMEEVKKIQGE